MRKTCEEAMVPVITGDTKVVERGAVEKIVVISKERMRWRRI